MKTKGFLKGLFGLFLGLGLASSANAVTFNPNVSASYELTGNIKGNLGTGSTFTGNYSLLSSSYFTYDAVNKIVSVVLNLTQSLADGSDKATIIIDRLDLNGTALKAPTDITAYAGSGGFKDIGNFFPTNSPSTFTNFAIMKDGLLSGDNFKLWGKYFTQSVTGLGAVALGNQVDFHLKIGGIIPISPPANVPEPMSMSLLGMGLIGGIINRRKKATA